MNIHLALPSYINDLVIYDMGLEDYGDVIGMTSLKTTLDSAFRQTTYGVRSYFQEGISLGQAFRYFGHSIKNIRSVSISLFVVP